MFAKVLKEAKKSQLDPELDDSTGAGGALTFLGLRNNQISTFSFSEELH